MALTALTWRQLPVQTLAAGYTLANLLDAVYTALGSSTYVNGAARTPGSGVAWTVARYQAAGPVTQAVYAYPPTNTLTQQVILAGATTAKTPVLAASQAAFATNTMYGGLAKNAGAFATWDGAAPFTSGQFSGYVAAHTVQATYALQVRVYESQDGILVIMNASTVAQSTYFFAGGLVDPETGDTTSDSESDGKLYVLGCGNSTLTAATIDGGVGSASGNYLMFAHQYKSSLTHSNNKCLAFTPGGSALLGLSRTGRYVSLGTALSSRAGKYARLPLILGFTDTALNYTEPPITYAGRLREICFTRKAVSGSTLRSSGTDVGYYISDDVLNAVGSMILSC